MQQMLADLPQRLSWPTKMDSKPYAQPHLGQPHTTGSSDSNSTGNSNCAPQQTSTPLRILMPISTSTATTAFPKPQSSCGRGGRSPFEQALAAVDKIPEDLGCASGRSGRLK